MEMEAETKKIIRVEEEDEIEGKIAESNDYIFDKIGDPVPLKPDGFTFDPQSSPSRPLAVSDKHGLLFAAHSSGFFVAKTKDVMAAAIEIKEDKGSSSVSSIEKVSVADVPLADLHILALSTDNSTLAAATAHSDVHFFSVASLIQKGLEPSFSISIDESTSIKDMQWTKNSENMYVLLSNLGKLYRGTIGGPLTDVMDDVDAVEWSSKGSLIAVARKDILNILSSKFSQRSSIQLSFKSWIDDSDTHCIMKVDSIRWVRRDSIILGCFQLTADRTEENYVVQVIQIKDGKFTDDSCKPVVIYFNELFSYLVDDIFPPASGPYLLLSYLEECKLAIIGNRKNADQHVVYLSWSLGEERNEVVTVDIPRDNLKPRIELQDNGDDNVIMGFCVDKVSMSENISVKLEMGHKEFSPYCILIFLTLDGKLVMYHVASVSDITFAPASVSTVSDEEDDDTALVPLETEPSKFSSQLGKQLFEKVDMDVPLGDENIKELVRKVGPDVITKDDLKSLGANVVPNQMLDKGSAKSNEKVVPPTIAESFRGQQEDLFTKVYPDRNVKQVQLSGQENRNMQHRSTEASTCEMEPAGLQSSGKITPSKGDFTVSDEEDDYTALISLETEPSKFSTQLRKQPFENFDMDVPLGDENIKELVRKVGPDVITKDDLKSLDANVVPNQMLDKGSTKSNENVVPPTIEQSFRGQQEDLFTNVYPDGNVKQVQLSGQENRNMQHRSTEASTCEMEPAGLQSSGKITPSKGDFTVSVEEDDYTGLISLETEPSKFSTQLGKQPFEKFDMDVPLGYENIKGLVRKVGPDVITKDDLNSLDANVVPNQMLDKGSTKSNEKVVPPTIDQSFRGQQEDLFTKVYLDRNVKQVQLSGQENRNMQHRSTEASTREMESAGLLSSGTITPSKGIDVNSSTGPSIFGSRSANASQLVGVTDGYGQPFHKKDISGTSPAVNFSGMLFENRGRPSTPAGNIVSVPSISSSQMSSQESVAFGKSLNHKVHPLKENYSDSFSRRLNSESKQFGNITDMTKELDMFLQSIEEAGGFRDACIVDQKSSVEELEREVGSLSERCQMWKNTINERLHEVQHLFDMTVQVLARKIYMEGIVKQASDSRYWDFWSCQKLSSELELKRRRISKMNQDLTDQLIQLERHFNGLELNKFGDNEGAHAGRRASQTRCGPSRHIQSLHSLHSTMKSQLAAADQLSECLSKQMATLKIESPTLKQKNVKKELFETIGIPYDASFSSPSSDLTKFSSTPKDKVLFSLGSSAAKEQPRRNASATKNYEPETARRRRDSLDRSWANYEPTKATVKRLLLQESGKATVSRSSLSVDKQRFSSRLMDGSAVTRPRDRTMPATFLHPLENEEGIKDTHAKQEKFVLPSESSQKPSSFMLPTQTVPLFTKPSDILNSYPKESAHPTEDSVKAGSLKATFAPVEAGKKHDSPFSLKFPVSVAPNLPGKSPQLFGTTSKSRPVDMSPSALFSVSASSSSMFSSSSGPLPSVSISSSASPTLSSVMSLNSSMASFNASADLSKPLSTSPLSALPSPTVFPSGSFSLNASKGGVPSSDTSTVTNSASETPKINLNANTMPPMESGPSAAETKLKLEPSISSPLTVEISTGLASQSSLGNASPASALAPESQPSFKNTASPAPAVEPESQPSFKNSASPAPAVAPESQNSFKNTASPAPAVEPECQPSFKNTASPAPAVAPEIQHSFKNTASPAPVVAPESQHSFKNTASPTPTVTINAQKEQPSAGKSLFPIALSNSGSVTGGLDVQNTQEDDMDEEAPDTSSTAELSLGSLSAFGLGSSNNPATAKPNPFGGSFVNPDTSMTTSPFGPRSMTNPSGELFQPASFNFQSLQPSQSSQPANSGFAGGFGTSMNAQAPTPSGFGQPTQVGPGQQALGSVLGAFGQSRQIGTGLPGTGFGSPSGFAGGVAGTNPGGFSGAATGGFAGATSTVGGFASVASGSGGFASLASGGGGFGGAASGGGGFGGAASGGGGFGGAASVGGGFGGAAAGGGGFGGAAAGGGGFGGAGGGFAGAAPTGTGFPGANVAGGGFGAFGGQQQAPGGFSAFGSGGATGKPSQLFTQMRK